jgi:hypothetical protein
MQVFEMCLFTFYTTNSFLHILAADLHSVMIDISETTPVSLLNFFLGLTSSVTDNAV